MEKRNFLSPELLDKLINKLKSKGVDKPCPMCGHENFLIENGLIVNILQDNLSSLHLYGPGLVSIFITCENCGYVAQFSLDALGMMDEVAKNVDKKSKQ